MSDDVLEKEDARTEYGLAKIWRLVKLITTLKVTIKITPIPQIFSLVKGPRRKTNFECAIRDESGGSSFCCSKAAWLYGALKDLQLEVIMGIATGRDMCLLCCQVIALLIPSKTGSTHLHRLCWRIADTLNLPHFSFNLK